MSFITKLGLLVVIIAILATTLPMLLPPKLLQIAPIISSTISLTWAIDEYQFLSSWMSPLYRPQAAALLPAWFKTWGPKGTWVLFGSFGSSLTVALANIVAGSRRNAGVPGIGGLNWYWVGLAFTMGHFAFGPKALGLLAKIRNDEPKGNGIESLEVWLNMHMLRTFVVDLPAVLSYVIAAVIA